MISTPDALPGEMSFGAFRAHPVTQTIRDASYGGSRGLPTEAELDRLGLAPAKRRAVAEACRDVAAINDEGDHKDAWEAGDRRAVEILASLPAEQLDPDYLTAGEPDPLADLNPDELAARVGRIY